MRRWTAASSAETISSPATSHSRPRIATSGSGTFAAREADCPVAQDVSDRLLRLPFHNNLTDADLDRVVATFLEAATATLPDR